MGLFDNVLCDAPLPDNFRGTFQTKDFDCLMETYRITSGGRLLHRDYSRVKDEHSLIGIRRLERDWSEVPFHGILNFYDFDDDGFWHEYDAKFTEGRLVEILARPVWKPVQE